ncbi:MAG TPA: septal ring lytic transglycosylase RlpA family protein [Spirochaetia bacterium]|nr:septal ring lytic transglycosylase RlpA family protein [Spirochaetia bacterium]
MKGIIALIVLTILSPVFASAESGLASWYGGKFHGRMTSSGEVFNTNKLTAAHKTLPFGTIVKVTNLDNGKSVQVKINDRGPFVNGRIIDLSRAAAIQIGMIDSGVAHVSLQIVEFVSTSDLYAIQVGAFGQEQNAEKTAAFLESSGFTVTTEKSPLGITRVFVRALQAQDLLETQKKLVKLGFTSYLVRKERTESPQEARLTQASRPGEFASTAVP